ncbi:MAG: hypothetical protein WAO74_05935 [Polaribacter sp.]|uniref:tetratricopeptide repeat protein n=1 Tax=Polaribacter sp. TaxID=1920175 RepID=UPI003BAEA11A
MILRIKNRENRIERQFRFIKLALFYLFFFLFSGFSFSQDSIPEKKDLTEEKELKFQEYFFQSLSQKSIGNYQKAIENLENCNQIVENDVAVFFEFSKNYLWLNKTLLAKEYIIRALEKDAKNIWMLKHLVEIYEKDKNFEEAIEIQQKIIGINPKEREFLVKLYMYNKQFEEAISLMNVLESEDVLSSNLERLRASLLKKDVEETQVEELTDITSLIDDFDKEKTYKTLEQILKAFEDKPDELLKYSEEGILLFPAQPYVYLMNAKALNYQKNYKTALTILQNGIDFVIDDEMEADFYEEMANAYKGLGNAKEENNYLQKVKKLKS